MFLLPVLLVSYPWNQCQHWCHEAYTLCFPLGVLQFRVLGLHIYVLWNWCGVAPLGHSPLQRHTAVELFQILKDDTVEMLHLICQQIWKTQQWPRDWKMSVFTPIPKKGNAKECSNHCTIALISHASKVMLKILQARLQPAKNHELSDVQAGFRKGRGTRNQIANIHWIIKKARELKKKKPIYFCFIDYAKVFVSVDYNKLENPERDGTIRPPDLTLEKSVCRSGSNS